MELYKFKDTRDIGIIGARFTASVPRVIETECLLVKFIICNPCTRFFLIELLRSSVKRLNIVPPSDHLYHGTNILRFLDKILLTGCSSVTGVGFLILSQAVQV